MFLANRQTDGRMDVYKDVNDRFPGFLQTSPKNKNKLNTISKVSEYFSSHFARKISRTAAPFKDQVIYASTFKSSFFFSHPQEYFSINDNVLYL